jgi:hypothetical protein
MPIEYAIDHARRLVTAKGRGILTDQDVFGYQCEVWSRPDVAGYDELIDMSAVERINPPSANQVIQLAQLSAAMDAPASASKLAVIAPADLAFGLGRMYQAYRGLEARSTKEVGVFRSREEALAFLGIDSAAEKPAPRSGSPSIL